MAWKLWSLAALLTVLLAVTDATNNAAEIGIIGGNVKNIGDKAEIQCNYTYHPFYNPTFIINVVTTDLEENKDGLGEYAHNSSSINCPYAQFGFCIVHTLTLSSVSRDYNGTTYQCHAWRHPSGKSGIVTLIIRDPATEEPTADKDSTPRTGPPQTSLTTDVSLVSNMHATTSIIITTTQKLGALDASHPVPHDSTKTGLDSASLMSSDIQLVHSTAMASPVSTHFTTAGKPSIHTLKNTIVPKSSTTMMTSVATTTTTSTVSPTKKSSQVVGNSVSSVLSSTVTPMVSSSMTHPSKVVTATTSSLVLVVYTTSSGPSVTQTAKPSSTPEVVNRVNDDAFVYPPFGPPTNTPDNGNTGLVSERVLTSASQESTAGAPSYVNIVVGSVTGVTVYLLTIILIGIVIHFGVKAKKNRSKSNRFPTPPPHPTPPPPLAPGVEMTHNPVYGGIPAPPAYMEHTDFGGNRDVVVNMDVSYHDAPGRKSVAVESLYDYVQ